MALGHIIIQIVGLELPEVVFVKTASEQQEDQINNLVKK